MSTEGSETTYWILRRDQIECLASPRRQDLLDRLASAGPQSVKECAGAVGLKPSAAYRHLAKLREVGLIRVAGTRVVRRKQETLFEARAPRMRLAAALGKADLHEPLEQVVAALCRQLERDFNAGLGTPDAAPGGAERNVGFYRHVAAPDAATLAEINAHLTRIAELMWREPTPGRPLIGLGWVMAPVGKAPVDHA